MSRCDVESRHPADAGTETSNSPAEAPQGHEMRRAGKNYDDHHLFSILFQMYSNVNHLSSCLTLHFMFPTITFFVNVC